MSAATTSTVVPPEDFVCPLSKELMSDPVMTRYGHHFERKAILEWLEKGNTYCPITGNPLRVSNLVSNKTLKWKINYWAKKHGQELVEVEDTPEMMFGGTLGIAIPERRFLCLLTKELMEDPVMSKTGLNFERKTIMKWMDDMGPVCPITKDSLLPSDFVSNQKLQWEINQWQLNYGDAAKEMTKLELETKLSKAIMVSNDYHISDIIRALTVDAENEREETKEVKPSAQVLDVFDEVLGALDA